MSSDPRPMRPQLRSLLPYIRPYTRGILAGLAFTIAANAFQVIGPLLIGQAIDAFRAPATAWPQLQRYAAFIVAAALLGGASRFAMRQLLNGISRRIEN